MLLATTAIILPDVSFTVPCSTSSGITKHRFPLVQFGAGRVIPSLATMGLTNGSRRPRAPKALTAGFGFSAAACAAGAFCAVPGAGALAGTVTVGLPAVLVCFVPVVLTGATGFTAITAGFFAGGAFLMSVFLVAAFALSLATTTGVGAPFACVPAGDACFTGAVLVFTVGLVDVLTVGLVDVVAAVPLFGVASALVEPASPFDVLAAVPDDVLAVVPAAFLASDL